MKRPPEISYTIATSHGFDGVEDVPVEGYKVSPNFAARKVGSAYHLDHIPSGMGVPGVAPRTLTEAQADAEKLERATYLNGNKFHWETVTKENARLRARRAGKGFLSRVLGRKVELYPVG